MRNLELLEKAIEEIQQKKNVDVNLESIKRVINREFNTNCINVVIVQNNTSNYFFGMHIFPSTSERNRMIGILTNPSKKTEKLGKPKDIVIEIDSKLLNDVDATPKEIVAVMLHEIGHVVYSDKHQARIRGLYTLRAAQILGVGGIVVQPVPALISIFILKAFESSFAYYSEIQGELEADNFAVKCGYGRDLASIIEKILSRANTKELSLLKTSRQEEENAVLTWSLKQMINFRQRKSIIEKQLKSQHETEVSLFGKWAIQDAITSFNERKKASVPKVIVNESIQSYIDLKKNGISHLEIREIEIEIQKINDYEDKLYVVNRIFRSLKHVDRLIYCKEHPDEKLTDKERKQLKLYSEKDLKEHRKALNVLLDNVRNKKVTPKIDGQLNINMKYPTGYEG